MNGSRVLGSGFSSMTMEIEAWERLSIQELALFPTQPQVHSIQRTHFMLKKTK